jgi:DNA-binding transcriptional LysR family regulator
MLESVTLDQLRTFLATVDAGSFSAAGRRLGRAQSVVSQTLATLEMQLGVVLFDRAGRLPVLTPRGTALLADARAVVADMDLFKARAKDLAQGLEAELSAVVDVMFPIEHLAAAVVSFQAEFPTTPLRLSVEALGAVLKPVLDGRCAFAIMGSLPTAPELLTRERLLGVAMEVVASPRHPLGAYDGPVPRRLLEEHVQLVLTDRSDLSQGRDFGVLSPKTWRLADLGAKAAFLRAGLGWGTMPRHAIEADLAIGILVRLALEDGPDKYVMPMSIVYPTASPPGRAGRRLIDLLRQQTWM